MRRDLRPHVARPDDSGSSNCQHVFTCFQQWTGWCDIANAFPYQTSTPARASADRRGCGAGLRWEHGHAILKRVVHKLPTAEEIVTEYENTRCAAEGVAGQNCRQPEPCRLLPPRARYAPSPRYGRPTARVGEYDGLVTAMERDVGRAASGMAKAFGGGSQPAQPGPVRAAGRGPAFQEDK